MVGPSPWTVDRPATRPLERLGAPLRAPARAAKAWSRPVDTSTQEDRVMKHAAREPWLRLVQQTIDRCCGAWVLCTVCRFNGGDDGMRVDCRHPVERKRYLCIDAAGEGFDCWWFRPAPGWTLAKLEQAIAEPPDGHDPECIYDDVHDDGAEAM